MIRKWIAVLMLLSILPATLVSATAETESGINLDDIKITVGGVPIEELLGAAGGMFADSVEEAMGDTIDDLNGVFNEFADEMSGDIGEIERTIESMIHDTWLLQIPAVSVNAMIKRSAYGSAMELYQAQLSGDTDKAGKLARNATESGGNSIVYIFDEAQSIPAILEAVESGAFGEREMIFGLEGYTGHYAVSSVLYLAASDEPFALCNMVDLSDEKQFEAFSKYVTGHAIQNYDEPLVYGDPIVTVIFWNEDADADWLAVIAKEIPVLLE